MTQLQSPPDVAATPAAASPAKQRDAYFDNAKFLIIVLVVIGHVWAEFLDHRTVRGGYLVVYAFHMPLFVFLAGYFSRGFLRSTDKFRTIFPQLVVPYVVFSLIYRGQLVLLSDRGFNPHDLFRPHFLMWFLVAMVLWRLTAPLWSHLRCPATIAVGVSLVSGSLPLTADSTASRTLGLLPFFVLGLVIEPERLARLRGAAVRWAGAAVLVAALVAAFCWGRRFLGWKVDVRLLWWDTGYAEMGRSALTGPAARLAVLALAVVLGAAFLAIVPRRRHWFTALGTRTMYVYLLHGLVIKTFDYTGVLHVSWLNNPLGIAGLTLAAVVLATVLASAPVLRITRPLVEPRAHWLLRPSPQPRQPTQSRP